MENVIDNEVIDNEIKSSMDNNGNLEKSKEKEIIYGVKVSRGINQTLIWKILKKVYENKDGEGIQLVKEFNNAVKCLVSKKRIDYINSIC